MRAKPKCPRRPRRVAFLATIAASILLKIGCDKVVELVNTGTLSTPSIYVALVSCALGLTAVFVALDKAD